MSEAPADLMYVAWSLPQLIIVMLVVVLLFGRGKVSEMMGDVAKGIKNFKKGLAEDDTPTPAEASAQKALDHEKARSEMRAETSTETKA
jgi:sec-independent protein translocase protein TatA